MNKHRSGRPRPKRPRPTALDIQSILEEPLSESELFHEMDAPQTKAMMKFMMLAISGKSGTLDSRAVGMVKALANLRSTDPPYFSRFVLPDVNAAIAANDMPRLARAVLHCFWHALFRGLRVAEAELSQLEAWKRDVVASLPFELFCRRWHETGGTPTDRARYVAEKEGGDSKSHLQRFRRNRAEVMARQSS